MKRQIQNSHSHHLLLMNTLLFSVFCWNKIQYELHFSFSISILTLRSFSNFVQYLKCPFQFPVLQQVEGVQAQTHTHKAMISMIYLLYYIDRKAISKMLDIDTIANLKKKVSYDQKSCLSHLECPIPYGLIYTSTKIGKDYEPPCTTTVPVGPGYFCAGQRGRCDRQGHRTTRWTGTAETLCELYTRVKLKLEFRKKYLEKKIRDARNYANEQ